MRKYCMLIALLCAIVSTQAQNNVIDFTSPNMVTYGESAQVEIDGIMMLRAGNANRDAQVKYHEADGELNTMIEQVGAETQSLIVPTYSDADLNLDGFIKLNGANNDRVFLLNVVGFFTPFYVIQEQLP